MGYELNDTIKNLTPYDPIEGDYDVRLDANESFVELPLQMLSSALEKAFKLSLNRYPDHRATALCSAFANFYDVPFECVMAGNGSDELIALIISTFFKKDDELITLANDFSMYSFYGDIYNIKTSIFPKTKELKIDVSALIYYAKLSNAGGIIFSNPCNPTSLCLDKNDVLKIAKALSCLVIVDEAYMDFADESVLKEAACYDNLIILKTCSKAVGLAGIRLGFAVSNATITNALLSVKSPYNVNALTQAIGETVLSEPEFLAEATTKIIFSRDNLYSGILKLHMCSHAFEMVYETATNFVYIKTKYAGEIFERLKKKSIAVRYMKARAGIDAVDHVDALRICAGTKAENATLLLALDEIIEEMEL